MKNNFFKYILLILPIIVSSCVKDNTEVLKDQGSTFIAIYGSPEKKLFFSPFTDTKKVTLFGVRKNANSSAALQKSNNVLLTAAPDILDAYNEENGTNFEWLPSEIFTLADNNGVSLSGDNLNLNFGSGDFAKEYTINLDGSKWDISHKYAVAYRITDAGGEKIASSDSVIAFISVKNKWDGVYDVQSSTLVDNVAASLVSPFSNGDSYQYALETLTSTTCVVKDNTYGLSVPGMIIYTGTGYSYYGSFGLVLEFDPETDKIVAATNYYGQPSGNTRSAQLDESGVNTYDNGVVKIKFNMLQTSAVPDPPHIRCTWDEVWKYSKSR